MIRNGEKLGAFIRDVNWRDMPIDPPTPESVADMLSRWLQDQTKGPRTRYSMTATEKGTRKVIGEAILHVRRWRQGEIGWGVSSDYGGRGVGTEIGRAMLDLAFDSVGLPRVYTQCRLENGASRRIMEKLGMREEGILREKVLARGAWWSSLRCSILATEYAAQSS
jgi:ribosomal-protein-alanine N-acetyltransferase